MPKHASKTKKQLIDELEAARAHSAKLEQKLAEADAPGLLDDPLRFKKALDLAPFGIAEIDLNGAILYNNSAYERFTGYAENELAGLNVADLQARPEDGEALLAYLAELAEKQPEPGVWTGANLTKDGREILVEVTWDYKRNEQGEVTGFIYATRDVTREKADERRLLQLNDEVNRQAEELASQNEELATQNEELLQMQEELEQAYAKYRALFDSIRDAILVADTDRNIIHCNPAFSELFGYELSEIAGRKTAFVYAGEEQYEKLGRELKKHPADRNFFFSVDYKKKSGETFPGETNVFYLRDERGNVAGYIGLIRDVTEKRRAEEKLQRSAERLAEAQRVAGIGDWNWDHQTDVVTWSENLYHIFGLDPNQPPPNYEGQLDLYHPEDAPRLNEAVTRALNQGVPYDLEMRRIRPEGDVRWLVVRGLPRHDEDGRLLGLYGSVLDITARKRAEEALRESERFLRATLDGLSANISLLDEHGKIILVNKRWREFAEENGISAGAVSEGTNYLDVCENVGESSGTAKLFAEGVKKVLSGKEHFYSLEYPCHSPEEERWFIGRVTPMPGEGPRYVVVAHENITERKLAEEALRESEALLEEVGRLARIGGWEHDLRTRRAVWTKETYRIMEMPEDREPPGPDEHIDYYHPEDRPILKEAIRYTLETGEPFDVELRCTTATGREFWSRAIGHPVFKGGECVKLTGTFQDITARKRAEEALRESEKKYRTLFEDALNPVLMVDEQGGYIGANKAALDFLECTAAELMDKKVWDWAPPGAEERQKEEHSPFLARRTVETEYWVNGRVKTLLLNVVPVQVGGETVLYGIGQDVTAIKELRGDLERIFEMSLDFICIADINNATFTKINPTFTRVLGFSEQDLLGRPFLEFVHPEDVEPTERVIAEKLRQGAKVIDFENRYLCKDGGYRWLSWVSHPVPELGVTYAMARDVTEYKRSQQALRESEEKLRGIFETMNAGVILVDEMGAIFFSNRRMAELFGLEMNELVGSSYPDLVLEESAEADANMRRLIRGEVDSVFVERRYKKGDGSMFWGQLSGSRLHRPDGSLWALVGIITDVTEQKRTEEAVRESEERFRALFGGMRDAVFMHGFDEDGLPGRFEQVNRAACERLGYTPEELLQLGPRDIDEPLAAPRVIKETTSKIMRKGDVLFETVHVAKDGTRVPVEINAHLFEDRGRLKVLYIARDITERKRAEEELLRAKEDAEAANRAKSEFLANMSHEIRTPLNGVLGMLQLLQITPLEQEQKEYADTAFYSAKSLLDIIGDILDFSRIEAGKIDIKHDDFDLRGLVKAVLDTFRLQAKSKDLRIEMNVDGSAPATVKGDSGRLRQVLFNLVGNAVKFTDQGEILVSVRAEPADNNKDRLYFSVEDSGSGIPENKQVDLFEPFTQSDGSLTRRHQGTGLGLAIVKRLVRLMGGNVDIESEQGRGTIVRFDILVGDGSRAEEKEGLPGEGVIEKPQMTRVLVVEDNPVNRLMTVKMLEKTGYLAAGAEDGAQALEILAREKYDLVLMDIQMPVLDGVEATRRIRDGRAEKVDPNIPVLAMTAYAMKGDREKFLAAGMDDYVSKPVDMKKLDAALREALNRK